MRLKDTELWNTGAVADVGSENMAINSVTVNEHWSDRWPEDEEGRAGSRHWCNATRVANNRRSRRLTGFCISSVSGFFSVISSKKLGGVFRVREPKPDTRSRSVWKSDDGKDDGNSWCVVLKILRWPDQCHGEMIRSCSCWHLDRASHRIEWVFFSFERRIEWVFFWENRVWFFFWETE